MPLFEEQAQVSADGFACTCAKHVHGAPKVALAAQTTNSGAAQPCGMVCFILACWGTVAVRSYQKAVHCGLLLQLHARS